MNWCLFLTQKADKNNRKSVSHIGVMVMTLAWHAGCRKFNSQCEQSFVVDRGQDIDYIMAKLLDSIFDMQSYFKWYILTYYNILLYLDVTEQSTALGMENKTWKEESLDQLWIPNGVDMAQRLRLWCSGQSIFCLMGIVTWCHHQIRLCH